MDDFANVMHRCSVEHHRFSGQLDGAVVKSDMAGDLPLLRRGVSFHSSPGINILGLLRLTNSDWSQPGAFYGRYACVVIIWFGV